MSKDAIAALHQQIDRLYQLAEQRFERPFKRPKIKLDLSGKCAGQAWLEKNELRFNRALLEQYADEFIEQTAPHEIAHLLAHTLCGPSIRPHGPEWKTLMRDLFKRPATVRHSFDLTDADQRRYRFRYRCGCREIGLSATRHNRARRGTQYQCRDCQTPLNFIGEQHPSGRLTPATP